MPRTVTTEADALAMIDRLENELKTPRQKAALQRWVDEVQVRIGQTFEQEQDPTGAAWPQWQLRSIHVSSSGKKTLQSTGLLLASIVQDISEHIEDVSEFEAKMGTSVPYAHKHMTGGMFPSTEWLAPRSGTGMIPPGTNIRIPQREFIGVTPEFAERADELIGDGIMERLEAVL